MLSAEHQVELLCRGAVDIHVRAELEDRIRENRPLRVKAGFDPTRPDLHLGHAVLLQKMRQFQELGHDVTFVVGDFTAMVGDPTGRNELRPRLTREEVRSAATTYQRQAFKILEKDLTTVRYNSEWLEKLTPYEIIELGAKYTVARMLERDDFSKRLREERAIFIHEFLYPLLQAYNSVVLESDIELGGTDQLFNLLVGRDLMPRCGKRPQMVLTTPLLEGTDARVVDGKNHREEDVQERRQLRRLGRGALRHAPEAHVGRRWRHLPLPGAAFFANERRTRQSQVGCGRRATKRR